MELLSMIKGHMDGLFDGCLVFFLLPIIFVIYLCLLPLILLWKILGFGK